MAAKIKKSSGHFLLAVVARGAAVVFRWLPSGVALPLGRFLGLVFYWASRRHRRIARGNLRLAFGETVPEKEIRSLARAAFCHLGQCAVEFARLPRFSAANIGRFLDYSEWQVAEEAIKETGLGAIVVTGHVGLWEAILYGVSAAGYQVGAIARPIDNPWLDAAVNRIRELRGAKIYQKRGAIVKVMRALNARHAVGFLIDQDAGRQGPFVAFFGVPASTITIAAELHLKTGAPLVVLTDHRLPDRRRHRLRCRRLPVPPLTGDKTADALAITAACNRELEAAIRETPEQWLWLHQRWKHQPDGKKLRVVPSKDPDTRAREQSEPSNVER